MGKKDKEPSHKAAFAKSETAEIRIELGEYMNKPLVNIREFKNWQGKDGDMMPTKGGFTMKPEDFRAFVRTLVKFGKASGLIPNKNDDSKYKTIELAKPNKTVKNKHTEDDEPKLKKKKNLKFKSKPKT